MTSNQNISTLDLFGGSDGVGYQLGDGANGSALLTVSGSVSIDTSEVNVAGASGNLFGGTVPAQNGGDAAVSTTNLILTSDLLDGYGFQTAFNITGGAGSDNHYLNTAGIGGQGALTVSGSVSMDSSVANIYGGGGGSTDNVTGGDGGNAWATIGSNFTMTANKAGSNFIIAGGNAGDDLSYYSPGVAGLGGAATLGVGGAVSMDSSGLYVAGGSGGYGYGENSEVEGAGGNALMSANQLVITSNQYQATGLTLGSQSFVGVYGGSGSSDGNNGDSGPGGDAAVSINGAVSMDSSIFVAQGGDSYNGAGDAGATESNGGNAWVTLGGLAETSNPVTTSPTLTSSFYVTGGGARMTMAWITRATAGRRPWPPTARSRLIPAAFMWPVGTAAAVTTWADREAMDLFPIGQNLYLTSAFNTSVFTVSGGEVGTGYDGDQLGVLSGSATLTVDGGVTVDSASVSVTGGLAQDFYGASGVAPSGGNAMVSLGELIFDVQRLQPSGTNDRHRLQLYSGRRRGFEQSPGPGNGGDAGGGAALMVAETVYLDDSHLSVIGGSGGSSTDSNVGLGGNVASVSLISRLTWADADSSFDVEWWFGLGDGYRVLFI